MEKCVMGEVVIFGIWGRKEVLYHILKSWLLDFAY
jgi:hypothetical protein